MSSYALNKYHFITSAIVHLFVVFGINYMIKRDAASNKSILIFGAHSRQITKTVYKNSLIQFAGDKKSRSNLYKMPTTKKIMRKGILPTMKNIATKSNLKNALDAVVKEKKIRTKTKISKKPLTKIEKTYDKKIPVLKKLPIALVQEPLQIKYEKNMKIMPPVASENLSKKKQDTEPAVPFDNTEDLRQDEEDTENETINIKINGTIDPVASYHQSVISQEFNRLWQPPIGVRKGTECSVKIFINENGIIHNVNFIKRSQVPIYDLSILRLKNSKPNLPPTLFNKHVIVVFYQ